MKLEDQVCSLGLSRRLKELGVKQESLFCYIDNYELEFLPTEIRNNNVCIAAFTVAELGSLLPCELYSEEYDENLQIVFSNCTKNRFLTYYIYSEEGGSAYEEESETEAESRAKMLIYLLENNLINNT